MIIRPFLIKKIDIKIYLQPTLSKTLNTINIVPISYFEKLITQTSTKYKNVADFIDQRR